MDNNYFFILDELCEYCPYKNFGCRPSYYVSIKGDQILLEGVYCNCEDYIEETNYISLEDLGRS